MNWWIIFIIFVMIAAILFLWGGITKNQSLYDCGDMFIGIGIITSIIAFFLLIACISGPVEYRKWEESFNIQKQMYADYNFSDNENIIIMTDIINANRILAEKQAARKLYGNWTFVPERIFEMTPIGFETNKGN